MAKNFWGYPDCGNMINYSPIESSGAISLGTTAGTNRSISSEFSTNHPTPSTPHKISEYQGSANFAVKTRWRQYGGTWSSWNTANDLGNWGTSDSYTTTCDIFDTSNWWHVEYCLEACSTNSLYPRDYGDPTTFSDYHGRRYCCFIDTRIRIAAISNMSGYTHSWSGLNIGWTVGQNLRNTAALAYGFYFSASTGGYVCIESRWRIGYYPNNVCKCSIHCWC